MSARKYKQAWGQHNEEEVEDVVEKQQQDDAKSETSERTATSTGSAVQRAGRKYVIYLKLVGMLFLPIVMVVVLSALIFTGFASDRQDRSDLLTLSTYLYDINHVITYAALERSHSIIYVVTQGTGKGGTVYDVEKYRTKVDAAVQEFENHLAEMKGELPMTFLRELSACRHFITQSVSSVREEVDHMPADDYSQTKIIDHYNEGIEHCVALQSVFPSYTLEGKGAFELTSCFVLVTAKELISRTESKMALHLESGKLYQSDVVYQATQNLRTLNLLESFQGVALPAHVAILKTLMDSTVGKSWQNQSQIVVELGAGYIDDYHTVADAYITGYENFMNELETVVDAVVLDISQRDGNYAYQAWLICVMVVAGLTPVIAVWAGRAIALPFSRLESIKKKLKAEKLRHTMHSDAVNRFVPFESLELLGITDITEVEVGVNQIRRLTIMFNYLHNFNLLSSRLGADNLTSFLNKWLDGVLPHIASNAGIVDKFMGDGMLIFFYKPEEALKTGLRMFEWLTMRNKEAAVSGGQDLQFGVGINSGDVCIGTIGSDTRMTTTTIGDEVNVAARVQSCTKMYQSKLLVTESAKNFGNANSYSFRALGQTTVKGRPDPVEIYEALDCLDTEQMALKKQTNIQFQEALKLFKAKEWPQARDVFAAVLEMNHKDGASQFYSQWIDTGVCPEFIK